MHILKPILIGLALLFVASVEAQEAQPDRQVRVPVTLEPGLTLEIKDRYQFEDQDGLGFVVTSQSRAIVDSQLESGEFEWRASPSGEIEFEVTNAPDGLGPILEAIIKEFEAFEYFYLSDAQGFAVNLSRRELIDAQIAKATERVVNDKDLLAKVKPLGFGKPVLATIFAEFASEFGSEEPTNQFGAFMELQRSAFLLAGAELYVDFTTEFDSIKYIDGFGTFYETLVNVWVENLDDEGRLHVYFEETYSEDQLAKIKTVLKEFIAENRTEAEAAEYDKLEAATDKISYIRYGDIWLDLSSGLPVSGEFRTENSHIEGSETSTYSFEITQQPVVAAE